jgi:hypothetical protein
MRDGALFRPTFSRQLGPPTANTSYSRLCADHCVERTHSHGIMGIMVVRVMNNDRAGNLYPHRDIAPVCTQYQVPG